MNEGTGAHHVTGVLVPIRVISLVERKPVLTRESVVGHDGFFVERERAGERDYTRAHEIRSQVVTERGSWRVRQGGRPRENIVEAPNPVSREFECVRHCYGLATYRQSNRSF
jgi:hypothetical protein